MSSEFVIKKDISEHLNEIINMYHSEFGGTEFEAQNVMTYMIDLTKSYGYFRDDLLVSIVCISPKIAVNDKQEEYSIVNVCAVMTKPEFRGNGYMKKLLDYAVDDLTTLYDSVVIQSQNWDIYKDFDLIDSTIKYEYEYIPGVYPTPMIMIWEDPNIDLVKGIESTGDENFTGILNDDSFIQAKSDIYFESGCRFLANPFAYIWINSEARVIDSNYNQLAQLTWLLNSASINGNLLLFEENLPEGIECLKPTNKKVVVTKTFAKSKKVFKNLKLIDFLV